MKTHFRMLFLFAIIVQSAAAQTAITIDTNDVKSNFAIGKVMTQYTDTSTTSINIGSPSTTVPNTWNFSSLRTQSPLSLTSIAVAGAPGVSNFPGATHCLRGTLPFSFNLSGIGTIVGTANMHQYLRLAGDAISQGSYGPGTGQLNGSPIAGNLTWRNIPTEILYKLPLTVGTTWTMNPIAYLVVDVTSPIPIPGAYRDSTRHNARYIVDAFGTMTLPGSSVQHPAVRLRRIDVIRKNLDPERAVQSFIFLAKNGASVNFTACDTNVTSGTITLCGSTQWNGPMPTDVRLSGNVPAEFALQQNYPNPFNPTTRIEYKVANEEFVSLKVYNLLGQEVATLVNDMKSPGTYAADWSGDGFPSGMYFYKMQTKSFNSTRRMMLVK